MAGVKQGMTGTENPANPNTDKRLPIKDARAVKNPENPIIR